MHNRAAANLPVGRVSSDQVQFHAVYIEAGGRGAGNEWRRKPFREWRGYGVICIQVPVIKPKDATLGDTITRLGHAGESPPKSSKMMLWNELPIAKEHPWYCEDTERSRRERLSNGRISADSGTSMQLARFPRITQNSCHVLPPAGHRSWPVCVLPYRSH